MSMLVAAIPITLYYSNQLLVRFISYNADWIGWALGIDQTIPGETQKMKPWNNLPSPAPQPAQIMDRIGN
jgi:hypothetical protein